MASVIGNGIEGTCDSALARVARRVAALRSGLRGRLLARGEGGGVELLVRTEMGAVLGVWRCGCLGWCGEHTV